MIYIILVLQPNFHYNELPGQYVMIHNVMSIMI